MKHADPAPGIYTDIAIDDYHAGPGVSNSMLSSLARSPLHCYRNHIDPDRPPMRDRPGQLEGSLMHCALFEPGEFSRRYAVGPTVHRSSKDWKHFVQENPDRVAIQQPQADVAWRQAEAIRALPDMHALLAACTTEVSAYWIDEETGLLCRCRPDAVATVGEAGVILLDGKTYSDASPREFARQVWRKGYHRQDAHYSTGYAKASDKEVLAFVFLAVETEWPYAASACTVDEDGKAVGRAEVRRLLDRFAECQRDGSWPGYGSEVHEISLPAWAA